MQTASPTNRFLAAFNRIDELMRKRCQMLIGKHEFSAVLSEFEKRTYFTERDFLQLASRLRNVIVHDKKTIPHFACWCLEGKLADARRDTPVDETDPEFLTVTWDTASTSGA